MLALLLVALLLLGYVRGRGMEEVEASDYEQDELIEATSIPYEQYFRQYADTIGWDWEVLAAVCYEESFFNPEAVSWRGASGLMQLMPKTAAKFNLNDSTIFVPEENIRAGAEYLKLLEQTFSFIGNDYERLCFVLAAYNAGPAHIMDARRLAKRYGRSAYVWFDNTEYWLERLQEEEIGTDSVVLYGVFDNPQEPISYVKKVLRTADKIKREDLILRD